MLVSSRLSGRMEQIGISQAELARRIGMSQQAVGKLVHGQSRETPKLHQIAKQLRTTPDYLEGRVDDPEEDADTGQRLASDELELIDLYQRLSSSQRKAFRVLLREIANDAPSGAPIDKRESDNPPETN